MFRRRGSVGQALGGGSDRGRPRAGSPIRGTRFGLGSGGGAASERAGRDLAKIARSTEHSLFTKYRSYLRLVSEAKPEEMADIVAAIAREVPDGLGRDELIEIAGHRWAEADPEGAMEALVGLKPAALVVAWEAVIGTVVEHDPHTAWYVLTGAREGGGHMISGALTSIDYRERGWSTFLASVAEHHPDEMGKWIGAIEGSQMYGEAVEDGLTMLAFSKPELALEVVKDLPPASLDYGRISVPIFRSLAESDREAAIAALDGLPLEFRREAMGAIAESWADDDPAAAYAWISELPEGEPKGGALGEVFSALARADPAQAQAAFAELTSPSERKHLAYSLANGLVSTDIDTALVWARDSLEGETQQKAFETILGEGYNILDHEAELELADSIPGAPEARVDFAGRWAEEDPEAAAAWAQAQGGTRQRC